MIIILQTQNNGKCNYFFEMDILSDLMFLCVFVQELFIKEENRTKIADCALLFLIGILLFISWYFWSNSRLELMHRKTFYEIFYYISPVQGFTCVDFWFYKELFFYFIETIFYSFFFFRFIMTLKIIILFLSLL